MLLCTPLACAPTEAASQQRGGSVTETDSAIEGLANETKPSDASQTARGRTAPGEDTGKKAEGADGRQSPRVGSDKSVGSPSATSGAAASGARGSAATQRVTGQVARPNADRLRSLLNAQVRGRPSQQRSRGSVGPSRPVANGRGTAPGTERTAQTFRSAPVASRLTAEASGRMAAASGQTGLGSGRIAASGPTGAGPTGQTAPTASTPGRTGVTSGPAGIASASAVGASMPTRGPSSVAIRAATGPGAVTRANGRGSAIGGPRAQSAGLVGGSAVNRTVHSAMVDGTQFHRGR